MSAQESQKTNVTQHRAAEAEGSPNHKASWILTATWTLLRERGKVQERWEKKGAILFGFYERKNNDSKNVSVR